MPYQDAFPCSVYAPAAGRPGGMSRFTAVPGALILGAFAAGPLARSIFLGCSALSDVSAASGCAGSGRLGAVRGDPHPEIETREKTQKTQNRRSPRREGRKMAGRPANLPKYRIARLRRARSDR